MKKAEHGSSACHSHTGRDGGMEAWRPVNPGSSLASQTYLNNEF